VPGWDLVEFPSRNGREEAIPIILGSDLAERVPAVPIGSRTLAAYGTMDLMNAAPIGRLQIDAFPGRR